MKIKYNKPGHLALDMSVILSPGINIVSDKVWQDACAHPHIKQLLQYGILELIDDKPVAKQDKVVDLKKKK